MTDEQLARQQAIKQIERRRRFWLNLAVSTVVMVFVTAIWAVSEYWNAGGWPTGGFSQSSGIPNVWNAWIIYPWLGWLVFVAAGAFSTFLRRPISEAEIRREIERQTGRRES
jgi:hypothetical protein